MQGSQGVAVVAGMTIWPAHLYIQVFILLLFFEPKVVQGAASPHAPLSLHVITDARGLPLSLPCICPLLGLHHIAASVTIAATPAA